MPLAFINRDSLSYNTQKCPIPLSLSEADLNIDGTMLRSGYIKVLASSGCAPSPSSILKGTRAGGVAVRVYVVFLAVGISAAGGDGGDLFRTEDDAIEALGKNEIGPAWVSVRFLVMLAERCRGLERKQTG